MRSDEEPGPATRTAASALRVAAASFGRELVNTGRPKLFVLAEVLLFGIAVAPAAGVAGALLSMVFDADVRYSGLSIGYTLAQVAGPAFAPTLAAALVAATGSTAAVVVYILCASAVSLVAVLQLPATGAQRRRPRARGHRARHPVLP